METLERLQKLIQSHRNCQPIARRLIRGKAYKVIRKHVRDVLKKNPYGNGESDYNDLCDWFDREANTQN